MARLGSIKYQVSQIIQKVNGIGTSKKETREQSGLKSLESGHKVSDKVHSFKSLENLRNDLTNLANFAKAEFQIRDIKEINIDIVSSWIESKDIGYNTASNYMSELNKVSDHFNFTKEEILALYLNAVSYPDNVFGIRNAAKTFFQKEGNGSQRISI